MWASINLGMLPPWYIYSFAFALGALFGSFLNVCIYRIPEEGMTVWRPAISQCPTCANQIRWYDNIPILSYVWLRGRCRGCGTSISMQYPLVELMTAVMAVATIKRFGLTWATPVIFALICALIVITFIDLAHWIIPDEISLPGIVIGIGAAYLIGPPHLPTWQNAVWGAVFGGGSLLLISLFYEIVMKRTGMGFGDVKLLAMLGAFLGWKPLFLVLLLASVQGLVCAVLLYFLGWRYGVPDDLWEEEDEEEASLSDDAEASEASSATEATAEASNDAEATVDSDAPDGAEATAAKEPSEEPDSGKATSPSDDAEASTESDAPDGAEASAVTEATDEASDDAEAAVEGEAPDGAEATAAEEGKEVPLGEPEDAESAEALEDGEEEEEEEVGFRQVAIPFGPFLSLAALELLFWKDRIFAWLLG